MIKKIGLLKKAIAALPDDTDLIVEADSWCEVEKNLFPTGQTVKVIEIDTRSVTLVVSPNCNCGRE